MKMTFKKMTAWFLTLAMLFSFVPVSLTASAEEAQTQVNRDAFGIAMDGELTPEETAEYMASNPYGTEGWLPLFTVSELYYVEGHESGRYFRARDYDGTITGVRGSGTSIGSKNEGNDDGFTMMDTSPIDLNGTGSKTSVATVAYWAGGEKLQLFVTDENGNRITDTYNLSSGDHINHLEEASAYATTGFVSVAAGDFDGDGVDTIIAYIPRMDGEAPAIAEYKVSGKTISWVRDVPGENVFSMLGNHNLQDSRSKAGRILRDTPVVQILAEDVDKDNIDEVIITAGMNDTYDGDGNGKVGSQLFIYDFIPEYDNGSGTAEAKFVQTFKTALHENGAGKSASDSGRLRFASSSVGNVSATTGGVDFPEIISAGWVDGDSDDGIGLDGEKININQVVCTQAAFVGGTTVGSYSHSSLGSVETKEFVYGGFYEDTVESLVPVQVFSAWGPAYADAIFAGGVIYRYNNGGIEEIYHDGYFDDDDDGIGGSIITNGLVIDVTAGNFTNDPDGREQLIFATMQKREVRNQYFSRMFTYTCNDGEPDAKNGWKCHTDDWLTYKEGDAFITLCAPDFDPSDSVIVRIKSVSRTYTEPEVLAILEATPYFAEIPDSIGNSETVYGKSETTGSGNGSSDSLLTNGVIGFEWSVDDACAGFVCGAGFEVNIENNHTWSSFEEQYSTFEVNYSNDRGENAVIVYRRPVIAYEYEVRGADNTMVLAKEGELSTSMITVDEYNAAAEQYGLDKIPEGMLGEPGNPMSYRSTKDGLSGVATKDNQTTQYNGTGTVTQSFTNGTQTTSEFEYEFSASFTAYGMVFGVKGGGGAGYRRTETESSYNSSDITKAGTVSGIDVEGYDFQWQFAHWNTTVNGTEIPVLGYIVKDVVAPPSPPHNLVADDITTTSATISWEHGERFAEEYRVYQYFAQNDKYIQIATVDGTENSCDITNLIPDNTYSVVVRAYSELVGSVGVGGESVNSELLSFSTAPEGATPIVIDGAYDVYTKIGSDATFTVDVTLPGDKYTSVSYQWQVRESGKGWADINKEDGMTLTLGGVTKEMDSNLYRCEISALYSGSLITYYSDVGRLNVGKAAANAALSVSGYEGGEGTLEKPYTGSADYLVQSGTTVTDVVTEENKTVEHNGISIIVYATAQISGDVMTLGAPYYGYDSESNTYYALTEDLEVIGEIEHAFEKVYDGIDEAPEGFDSDITVTTVKDGVTYYLVATVEGTAKTPITAKDGIETVDTRLESITDITYYWLSDGTVYEYGEDGAVGDATDVNVAALYEVYVSNENKIVLGKGETYTSVIDGEEEGETEYSDIEEYIFYSVEYTPATDAYALLAFTETEIEKYVLGSEDYEFGNALLSTLTEEKHSTVHTPVYENEEGTSISLSAAVTDASGNGLGGSQVTFRVINTVTGAVHNIDAVANASGIASGSFTASSANLYKIEAIVAASENYLGATSNAKYYDALGTATADNTVEYRVQLTQSGDALAGTMPFGGTFGYKLQSRPTGESEWTDYTVQLGEAFTYTVTTPDRTETVNNGTSYTPVNAGTHVVKVYSGESANAEKLIASATLDVTRLNITVTPTWTATPASADDVTLVSSYGTLTSDYLKTVFSVDCPYFLNHKASGIFNVTLGYLNNEEADSFKQNYHVTLESGMFTIKPSSAPVYFDSGENGTVTGRSGDNLFLMTSGSSQTSGTKLTFNAEPASGYAVEKWVINGTEYAINSTDIPDWFVIHSNSLIIEDFDASEGSEQTYDSMLTVEVYFVSSSNVITYAVNGNEGGSVSAVIDDEDSTALVSGTAVARGANVIITAAPDDGYVIDGWVVNGENYTWDSGDKYAGETLSLTDIDDNYTVVVSFTESSEKYNVITSVYSESGSSAEELAVISATDAETGEEIALTGLAKNTSVTFTANLNVTNNTVKEWQTSFDGVTFTTVKGSGGKSSFTLYNIDKDTYVRAIVTNAQSFVLNYAVLLDGEPVTDGNIAALSASGNGVALESGGSFGAYIPVDFTLELNPDYYVAEWSDSVVASDDGKSATLDSLNANLEIDVVIAEKPIVSVNDSENGEVVVYGTNIDNTETEVVIEENSAKHVDLDSSVTVTATPEDDYYVESIEAGTKTLYSADREVGILYGERTVTLDNVDADVDVTVVFALKPAVTVVESENGSVAVEYSSNGEEAEITDAETGYADKRSDITITAAPEDDYYVESISAGSEVLYSADEEDGILYGERTVSFENVSEDVDVEAVFTLKPAVTVIESENGSVAVEYSSNGEEAEITDAETGYADKRSDITITATPDEYYYVSEVIVAGETVYADNEDDYTGGEMTFTVEYITEDADIEVIYEEKPVISFASDENVFVTATLDGEELSDGDHVEKYSGDITFTAYPEIGYECGEWTYNGIAVAPVNENIEENDITVYTVEGLITSDVEIVVAESELPAYTLTIIAEEIDGGGAHGEIFASVTRKALDGYTGDLVNGDSFYRDSNIEISVEADDEYRLKTYTWDVNGVTGKGIRIPEGLLENLQGDVTITARFVKRGSGITFDPTDADSTGGYISDAISADVNVYENSNGIVLEEGVSLDLFATVSAGYEVEGWYNDDTLVDGTEGMTEYTYTSNGEDETAIIVIFREILYAIEAEIESGSIEVDALTEGMARGGETLTFTATPDIGYSVCDWTVNGVSYGTEGNTFTWTVENGMAMDKATDTFVVEAVLERSSFEVVYGDTEGGTLESDTVSGSYVAKDDEITITAVPSTGYAFDGWIINGKSSKEAGETLTLAVTKDITVEAVFTAYRYTVTFAKEGERGNVKATADGKLIMSGAEVARDATLVITVTPTDTNMVSRWLINGETPEGYAMTDTEDAALVYTTTVTESVDVLVEIVELPVYKITVVAGENGSVSRKVLNVERNGSASVTAIADDYYMLESWTVDGVLSEVTDTTLTLEEVKKDMEVVASFSDAIRYDLTLTVISENGSSVDVLANGAAVYPTATESVRLTGNSNVVFTVNPVYGETVASWTVNGDIQTSIANELAIDKLTKKTDIVVTLTTDPGIPGDADDNGSVTIRDAALILQFIAGWDVEINLVAADVDDDKTVTIRDAALILQYIAGWDVELK